MHADKTRALGDARFQRQRVGDVGEWGNGDDRDRHGAGHHGIHNRRRGPARINAWIVGEVVLRDPGLLVCAKRAPGSAGGHRDIAAPGDLQQARGNFRAVHGVASGGGDQAQVEFRGAQ
jgi:hypothetical protein